jgi:hypothetical protein
MRQLTSLDAQFLGVETARTYGHVGGLTVLDPSTAPGGRLELSDLCRMVADRIHLLPPFRWRLVGVPFGIDLPYGSSAPAHRVFRPMSVLGQRYGSGSRRPGGHNTCGTSG